MNLASSPGEDRRLTFDRLLLIALLLPLPGLRPGQAQPQNPQAVFDRVVAVTVLSFVQQPDRVIAEMARGSYPLDGWVETIPFDGLLDRGFERLRRQQGMKILVEVGDRA